LNQSVEKNMPRSAWYTYAVCGAWLVSAHSATAVAQPAPDSATAPDADDYTSLISRGLAEYNLGHWSEARAFFGRAHTLRPNARTLRGLGLASYELRDYVAAIRYLEGALENADRPLTSEMRAAAQRQINEAESFVGHYKIRLEPSSASLSVDGTTATYERDGSLLLNPGEHTLRADANDHEAVTRVLTVTGGERAELRLELRSVEQARSTDPFGRESPPVVRPSHAEAQSGSFFETRSAPQWVGIALAGGAVIGAGVGVTFGVLALNENAAAKRHGGCSADGCTTPDALAHRNSAVARADVATVSFIGAGVLLGAGLLTYLLGPGEERAKPRLEVRPAVSRDGVAVWARTVF
jgi:hypothetical protein